MSPGLFKRSALGCAAVIGAGIVVAFWAPSAGEAIALAGLFCLFVAGFARVRTIARRRG